MNTRYPDWQQHKVYWPHAEFSQFVEDGGYSWHVQGIAGPADTAPICLLIHGTGASTHSWRDVMPLLAQHYRVIAVDLPGHGFTRPNMSRRVSLPGMAASLQALLDHLSITPDIITAHSAGSAIALEMMITAQRDIPLIGFTPALKPFPGIAAELFPQLAKMLFTNPFMSIIFSRMARGVGQTEKFLAKATGSTIDRAGLDQYAILFGHSGHCDGALRMMANWRLDHLQKKLPQLSAPIMLVHAANDTAIPPQSVIDAAEPIKNCTLKSLENLGHLAHEEAPQLAVDIITEFADKHIKA
ncbi:alpha/beta fold hydrolase BchO [Parasphingorhabdus sp. DH2-15]|uniref:alpha/beta fold hydrolase BchO n=1 Tax=Parasphingorhabdus sp. DH2-15 TaxID=3444112 RepID=UPI003F689562